MKTILVIDDEESICWGLKKLGESMRLRVLTASSAENALRMLEKEIADSNSISAIVTDVRLPVMDGLTAIEKIQELTPAPVIVITAYGDLQTAVTAVKKGAFEYLIKPFDLEKIQSAIERAIESSALSEDYDSDQKAKEASQNTLDGFIGNSPAMQEAFKQIALASSSNSCTLITGESGTGKELAARAIHNNGSRSAGPFIPVNVAALSEHLAESELFGHVRGAFTGADHERLGLIAQANGGTLFLDEVADIPISVQVKLLRCLEDGEIFPVGSNHAIKSDFRIICASHQNLEDAVNAGEFRHDLYYRLSAFLIELPPLREREEDIMELADYFARQTANASNLKLPSFSDKAIAALKNRPWNGNVRELRNVVERAVIVSRGGSITPEHFTDSSLLTTPNQANSIDEQLSSLARQWSELQFGRDSQNELHERMMELVEPELLKVAFDKFDGQYAVIARSLGIHRTTVKKKLIQYGIIEEET